ncbi:hypothetical protein GQ649_24265 [Rhodococcus sp. DSM 6344]|nr:hypothetical protein [Rhodococcus erythropolis]
MSTFSQDIIRRTLSGVANILGVQIDVPDETIADIAATLQTEIDRVDNLTTELAKIHRQALGGKVYTAWDDLSDEAVTSSKTAMAAVLAHLHSADRLLGADEKRLTAEQMEDVRTLVGHGGSDYAEAFNRLRALLPATEPAEERCQSVSIFRERCALAPGHEGRHAANGCAWGYPPAPVKPAEEETKADPFKALHDVIAFSSMDFGSASDVAWMYGIVVGWDNDDSDEVEDQHASMRELAQRFNWPHRKVQLLRNLHAEWVRRTSPSGYVEPPRRLPLLAPGPARGPGSKTCLPACVWWLWMQRVIGICMATVGAISRRISGLVSRAGR